MNWLYEILDVGRGVAIARQRMRGLDGMAALLVFAIYGALLVVFAWLWWTYDLASTFQYANGWVLARLATLPAPVAAYGPLVLACVNAAPTFVQLAFPRLARDHAAVLWVFAGAALFDLITDAPLVVSDVDRYVAPALAWMGLFATPARWLCYAALTIGASFVVQSLVFILGCSCWYLALNLLRIRAGRARFVGQGEP